MAVRPGDLWWMKQVLLIASLLAAPAAPQTGSDLAAPPEDSVSQERLRDDVETMVGFGTRHTLSSLDDPQRGIGAARRWAEAEFRTISEDCGGCLEIVTPERMVSGDRIPERC